MCRSLLTMNLSCRAQYSSLRYPKALYPLLFPLAKLHPELYIPSVSSRFHSATDTGSNFTKTTAIYLCKHIRRILFLFTYTIDPSAVDPLLMNDVVPIARFAHTITLIRILIILQNLFFLLINHCTASINISINCCFYLITFLFSFNKIII